MCDLGGASLSLSRSPSTQALDKFSPSAMFSSLARFKISGKTNSSALVTRHAGILGNEKADEAAKEGCHEKKEDPGSFTSLSYVNQAIREDMEKGWMYRWKDLEGKPTRGKHYRGTPGTRRRIQHHPRDRITPSILAKLRTNHINTRHYLTVIGKRDGNECQCARGKQTVAHLMLKCKILRERREAAKKRTEGKVDLGRMEGWLYTKEGVREAVELWNKFVKWKKNNLN